MTKGARDSAPLLSCLALLARSRGSSRGRFLRWLTREHVANRIECTRGCSRAAGLIPGHRRLVADIDFAFISYNGVVRAINRAAHTLHPHRRATDVHAFH